MREPNVPRVRPRPDPCPLDLLQERPDGGPPVLALANGEEHRLELGAAKSNTHMHKFGTNIQIRDIRIFKNLVSLPHEGLTTIFFRRTAGDAAKDGSEKNRDRGEKEEGGRAFFPVSPLRTIEFFFGERGGDENVPRPKSSARLTSLRFWFIFLWLSGGQIDQPMIFLPGAFYVRDSNNVLFKVLGVGRG